MAKIPDLRQSSQSDLRDHFTLSEDDAEFLEGNVTSEAAEGITRWFIPCRHAILLLDERHLSVIFDIYYEPDDEIDTRYSIYVPHDIQHYSYNDWSKKFTPSKDDPPHTMTSGLALGGTWFDLADVLALRATRGSDEPPPIEAVPPVLPPKPKMPAADTDKAKLIGGLRRAYPPDGLYPKGDRKKVETRTKNHMRDDWPYQEHTDDETILGGFRRARAWCEKYARWKEAGGGE